MNLELPDSVTAETLLQAKAAVENLRELLRSGTPPDGMTIASLTAVLTILDGVALAAAEDNTDISPSEAAERLGVARPSIMRLIARGELSSRKEGGHYVLSPRELRAFQARLSAVRREAMGDMTRMVEQFGF